MILSKRKICVVVTARPSYSRIKTALKSIQEHPELELQLILAASALSNRYGSIREQVIKDGFHIHGEVFNIVDSDNLTAAAKTTGLGIIELSSVFHRIGPEIVVTIADRYETIATAIASAYMNIPLAHIQGGEVTGNIDEKVRHAITKIADYHFVSSKYAHDRVLKLGEDPNFIFTTGCPSIDLAKSVLESNEDHLNPIEKYGGVGAKIDVDKDYLVVLQHPVTNQFEKGRKQIQDTLEVIHKIDIPTFWFWPNVDLGTDEVSKGIRIFREQNPSNKIRFFKNFESEDFIRLLIKSKCLIGNSSAGIRECSFLGVPVVNIGTRQFGRDRGFNVIDVGNDKLEIENAINTCLRSDKPKPSDLYGNGEAGKRIANYLSKVELKFHKKNNFK